jgi:cell division protein FtsQ
VSPIALPADRRFRRAHVKPSRRRGVLYAFAWPALKYSVLAVAAVYAVYGMTGVVAHARVLRIDRIVVHGNERLSSGEVLAVLNGLRGENIVWTDLAAWRSRLLASPWVRDAALRRSLPSTVEIAVSERTPVAIGRINGDLYLIDESGVVIDQYGPHYADLDLPIVDGLGARPGEDLMTDLTRASLASRLVTALRPQPAVARRLSQIDVSDAHNAAVILSGDPAVIYVGEERFLQRLQSYIELSGALRTRVPHIDYVDLRFEDRIYVRPVKSAKGAAAAVVVRR